MCCILALFFTTNVGDMSDEDRDRERDRVWLHGEKVAQVSNASIVEKQIVEGVCRGP
jgi:hypothetical protein